MGVVIIRHMLLAVDVGNTQTHIGAFDGETLRRDWRLGTVPSATADELAATISHLLALDDLSFGSLDGAIVSTVVPQLGPEYQALTERHMGQACLLVGPSLKTGMPILVDNPHELGADRLVNAVAAHAKVDGACVAVDFGTSTNFDVVSGAGEYLGGVIGPGVEISMEALTSRTAKLPRIDLTAPEGAIGKDTTAAIQSGFAYGFAGLVDGIDRRLADELGEPATFIATGGIASTIAPHCETIDEVDPLLTLTGLRLIYESNAS
jgi:type III pantothenate kinase